MEQSPSKEQFRQDMIRWLEGQDRNGDFSDSEAAAQGGTPINFEDGILHATDWAKGDVMADVKAGRVPRSVKNFSELHDYVDANGYGGAFDWPCLPSEARDDTYQETFIGFWNAVQEAVDQWIISGQMLRDVAAGRRL